MLAEDPADPRAVLHSLLRDTGGSRLARLVPSLARMEQLLAQAGWASGAREAAVGGGTEEAIRTDPRLSPEQRAALLGVYRSFVEPE